MADPALETQPMETCITVIANTILALSAAAGAIIAGVGLATWRRELHGQVDFNLARRVMRAVYKVRNEIRDMRSVFSPEVLESHWERIIHEGSELDVALLEAEVLWGDKLASAKKALSKCVKRIRRTIQKLRRLQKAKSEPSEEIRIEIYDILEGDYDETDEFGKTVQAAVSEYEQMLRPLLKPTTRKTKGKTG